MNQGVLSEGLRELLDAPSDQGLDLWQLGQERVPLLQLIEGVAHDHLGLRVLSLVLAGFGPVGDVDATDDIVVENGPEKGDDPLGAVEPHDIHRFPLLHTHFMQTLGKCPALVPVLLPRPCVLDPEMLRLLLYLQRYLIRPLILRLLKHLRNRPRAKKLGNAATTHPYWQLNIDIRRPVRVLAFIHFYELLIPLLRYRHRTPNLLLLASRHPGPRWPAGALAPRSRLRHLLFRCIFHLYLVVFFYIFVE